MSEQHNEKAGELTMTELEQSSADLYALLASLWRAAPRGEQLAWLLSIENARLETRPDLLSKPIQGDSGEGSA